MRKIFLKDTFSGKKILILTERIDFEPVYSLIDSIILYTLIPGFDTLSLKMTSPGSVKVTHPAKFIDFLTLIVNNSPTNVTS